MSGPGLRVMEEEPTCTEATGQVVGTFCYGLMVHCMFTPSYCVLLPERVLVLLSQLICRIFLISGTMQVLLWRRPRGRMHNRDELRPSC
ncbi:hypothetical protein NDU88_000843 [Pleurodeles waltl]|uniref:Uncharacterized protein n=1 Tax=Pleurodeles waltl TaxID=8319 RepID=A0AAV7MKW3_PLEWA|nr:hypothetical protein NDU88_000843 [Pleurodeles waltl]